jgi:hypothetical protein
MNREWTTKSFHGPAFDISDDRREDASRVGRALQLHARNRFLEISHLKKGNR